VTFSTDEGLIKVQVNDGETFTLTDPTAMLTLSFAEENGGEEAADGEFFIMLAEGEGTAKKIGSFKDIGSNYAEYLSSSSSTPMTPLAFAAEIESTDTSITSSIIFKELNGQSFALQTEGDNAGKILDNALPVLVVNEEVNSFLLGTPFSLDYEVIDVLDSSVTKTMQYYQYNPDDKDKQEDELTYSTLSTSTYFFDTSYIKGEGDDATKTSVYREYGNEFISVRFTLADDTHTGDDAKIYELVWYMDSESVKPFEDSVLEYIPANRNEEGARYTGISEVTKQNGAGEDILVSEMDEAELEEGGVWYDYQEAVTAAAKDVDAGSNSYVYLPSLRGLITDNDTGYKSLKFSIYYKTQSSDSASSSTSLSYDSLRIAVSSVGLYEFKVLATDKAGNSMYCYDEYGVRTKIDSTTIWEFDAIPSFTFAVYNNGLTVEEPSSYTTSTEGYIGVTYTLTSFTVTGLSGYSEEYGLYYFDTNAFRNKYAGIDVSNDIFSSLKFSDLKEAADLSKVEDEDYIAYYAELYAQLLTDAMGEDITAADLLEEKDGNAAIFRRIAEYDSTIDEDDHPDEWAASDNEYHWVSSSQSFKPQESGIYLILGVFTDAQLFGEKAIAYKAINVEADTDTITGETEWLKNNIASVILFSIAAVLLVIIIILLLIKPSDETLEDIEAEQGTKDTKKKKATTEKKAAKKSEKSKK
jgi:hypothetical protein